MTWRVANSVLTLHRQLRPLAPGAPGTAFGTIGDTDHSSTSDHAAKDFPGWGDDIVTAGDFPQAERLDPRAVLEAIRQSRDQRVKYGISNGQMFSSYPTSAYPAWTWRPYSGSDGHFGHGHLSVVGDVRADDPRPWAIGNTGGEADMDANQSQQLSNVHGWLHQLCKGNVAADAGTAHITTFVPNERLKALVDRPAAPPVTLTDAQVADQADRVAAALLARLEDTLVQALERTRLTVDPPPGG
jgi:hypothetical protein